MPIEVTNTSAKPTPKLRAVVFGPPGHTKTASSVTLSEHCPPSWSHLRLTTVPDRPLVELSDMLWISFDSQATLGFKQLGVSVPELDLSGIPPLTLDAEVKAAGKMALARVKSGQTKTIVVDTVSALDWMAERAARNAGLTGFDIWAQVGDLHSNFYTNLKACDANVLLLCHAKVAANTEVDAKATASAQKMAETAADKASAWGIGEIVPEISGKSLNAYRKDVSLVLSVSKGSQIVNGKAAQGFWFHSQHEKFDTKARLLLPPVLPADWRVVKTYL